MLTALRPRHEAFAQGVAAGLSGARAYAFAYSRKNDGASRASAVRLLANVNIQNRIAELRTEAASQAEASLARLIPLLEERARAEINAGNLRDAIVVLERLTKVASGTRL